MGPRVRPRELPVGYYDRAEDRTILVPFNEVSFLPGGAQPYQITYSKGRPHRVPFHRVREVYKDSQRIWQRLESRKGVAPNLHGFADRYLRCSANGTFEMRNMKRRVRLESRCLVNLARST